ncbi:MAG: NADH-quinone oxidoreductase subunit N [Gaiellaceae bacterium]
MKLDTPHVDWLALSPELSLLAAAGVCLLAAVLLPGWARRGTAAFVALAGFVTAGVFAGVVYDRSASATLEVGSAIARDRLGAFGAIVVCGSGILAVFTAYSHRMSRAYVAEYYALLATAGAGMCFFLQAHNLMTLFLGLEWFSIALYVLCAIDMELETSLESGLKYLIIGSFGSAALLFGSALVYGATGKLEFSAIAANADPHDALFVAGLAMMLVGFGYKASAAPFHQWTPDVYQGAPTPVTAFMSAATKAAALIVMLRVLRTAFPQEAHLWTIAVAVLACASLAVGNLAALAQRNVKRMLAYSSVSHAGFMLIPIAANNALGARALLYYLIPYCAMSVGAFAVVAARERELQGPVTLDTLSGMGWERPFLGVSMWVFMLGFAGFPLTGGFVGKFYAFSAAYDRGWVWLIIVGVVATLVSLYYYLGVVRAMYFRTPAELQLLPAGGSPPREVALQIGVGLALVVTIGSFFAVQPLIEIARHAAASLTF